ncbi:MAG: dehydrogenase [Prevotellaceae bacterium]|nr:dehydrogenase [Prevotellaceae bacterium]
MADNWLEKHREDYESRKSAWLKKRRHWKRPTDDTSSSDEQ